MAIKRSSVNRTYQPDEIVTIRIDPIGRKLSTMFSEINDKLAEIHDARFKLRFVRSYMASKWVCLEYVKYPVQIETDEWMETRKKYISKKQGGAR